jgi:microcystin-dependent protein
MSFRSSLDQRTPCSGVFYKNSTCQTFSNEETNLSLIASLQYVINFTNYYIYKTYLPINNPTFQGIMQGENITLSSTLSTPTIVGGTPPLTPSDAYAVSFTGSPTINNQKIEYDLLGEIKMCINELPLNFLLCDGSSYATADYPDLFNIIGYTYGGSDDNFNVPNFESYIPIGANSTSVNGNPTSNFVYGNGQSGATNTETISYPFNADPYGMGTTPMSMASSLLTKMPTHDHQNNEASHIHASNTILVTDHYYPSEVGLVIPFLLDSSVGTATNTAFTNITVLNSGNNIQSTDTISGLNGVNVSPPYLAVKFCICAKKNILNYI